MGRVTKPPEDKRFVMQKDKVHFCLGGYANLLRTTTTGEDVWPFGLNYFILDFLLFSFITLFQNFVFYWIVK